jgi:hypothetical protein
VHVGARHRQAFVSALREHIFGDARRGYASGTAVKRAQADGKARRTGKPHQSDAMLKWRRADTWASNLL